MPNEKEGKREKRNNTIFVDFTNRLEAETNKIEKILKNEKFFEWGVECDEAFNFEYYFPKYNPSNLCNRKMNLAKK